MTEVLHGFHQSLQPIGKFVPQIRQRLLPTVSFPIHYILFILPFDAKQSELLLEWYINWKKYINIRPMKV
jgi:hypothetical protein